MKVIWCNFLLKRGNSKQVAQAVSSQVLNMPKDEDPTIPLPPVPCLNTLTVSERDFVPGIESEFLMLQVVSVALYLVYVARFR